MIMKSSSNEGISCACGKSEKSGLIREINKEEKITLVSVLNSSNSMYFAQDIKVARIYSLIAGKPDIFRKNRIGIKK